MSGMWRGRGHPYTFSRILRCFWKTKIWDQWRRGAVKERDERPILNQDSGVY